MGAFSRWRRRCASTRSLPTSWGGASRETLQIIFRRKNDSGVAMREEEVFQALFAGDEPRPLDAIATRVAAKTGFGRLQSRYLLRCLKSVAGMDPTQRLGEDDHLDEVLLRRTEAAVVAAIQFLQVDVGFPHWRLTPYLLPLIVMARFFDRVPEPSRRNRTLLARWVWRGAVSGVHRDSNRHTVASHQDDLGLPEDDAVQALLRRVPREGVALPRVMEAWRATSQKTIIAALAMLDRAEIAPEIMTRALETRSLSSLFCVPNSLDSTAIGAHVPLLGGECPDLLDLGSDDLATLLVPAAAVEALALGDLERFVSARSATLEAYLHRFVALRAEPDESDHPDLGTLLQVSSRAV